MSMEAEASNQVLSMTLEGVKITAELAGSATKEITLAFFAAIRKVAQNYKSKKQITPGQQKLIHMLQSGKPLNQFVINNDDLDQVRSEAVKRGITFSAVKNKKDNISYITVYQQDAARINRLLEDIGIGDVDFVNMNTEPQYESNIEETRSDPISADETEQQTKEVKTDNDPIETNTDAAAAEEVIEMSEEDINDIFESFEVIESEGESPLDQAAKNDEAPSEISSPLTQSAEDNDPNSIRDKITTNNEKPSTEGFISNSPADRPSVKKRLDDIIHQQQADKAAEAAKAVDVVEKMTEAAKDVKEIINQ